MIQITSFPAQVRVEDFLTVSGNARGYAGRPLTVTFDDRFQNGAGNVAADGTWNVRFRFTQIGSRKLVFSLDDGRGNIIRSQPITISVIAAPPKTIQITSFPAEVKTREGFTIQGVSTGAAGRPVILTIDNQVRSNAGTIAADGTWQTQFQFLQAGVRRITAAIVESGPDDLVPSNTVTVRVVAASPRITITPPTRPIRAKEVFELEGQANGLEDGQQLVVRADRQYVLARPTVQNQRWQATLFFHQGGDRVVEVIVSDQEKAQITLDIQEAQPTLQVFPYTVWTNEATPDSIGDLVNPKRITLHHTVITALPANATQATEIQRMRRILDIHLNSSGYSDIGYHYIIMTSGRVYEGRSSRKVGAHDEINDGYGVAVDADLQGSLNINPTQFDTIVALCTMLCKRMGITDPVTPVNTQVRTSGSQIEVKSLPRIIGHRDRSQTACPGNLYRRLDEIRQAVRRQLQ